MLLFLLLSVVVVVVVRADLAVLRSVFAAFRASSAMSALLFFVTKKSSVMFYSWHWLAQIRTTTTNRIISNSIFNMQLFDLQEHIYDSKLEQNQ